ncbi:GerW family sporulation protein [Pararhodobacter sp.]|uniref:GerW family sporulation protein n=1 Tax=Pararhodobacter sp. TaxID=2127056 RepID=UPI002FE401F2
MDDVVKLLKGTVDELEKLLNAKNVLGDPIDRDGATVIPIVSYGFGFGAGGGTGGVAGQTGNGMGTAAGGGIRPVGAIIIDAGGARVEPVRGDMATMAEAVGSTVATVMKAKGKPEA